VSSNSTNRFSNRVEDYIRYRPGYPTEILSLLQKECGLTDESIIADIGSGTGISTEMFLKHGNNVFAIEPNRDMREAAERLLKSYPKFTSVIGTAEETTLSDNSVDFVVAGQAFHWFDQERSRAEFKRILRPHGWVVLIWNDRRTDATPFLEDYEKLLQTFSTDYSQVDHKRINFDVLRKFFRAEPRRASFPNFQHFDFTGLKGRLLSSSYAPAAGQPMHEEMLHALKEMFDSRQQNNRVTFQYDATVFYARVG
jgi:SAM-dependent methyltransferase